MVGFGFILFKSRKSVIDVLNQGDVHTVKGKRVECRPALLKTELKKIKNASKSICDQKGKNQSNGEQGRQMSNSLVQKSFSVLEDDFEVVSELLEANSSEPYRKRNDPLRTAVCIATEDMDALSCSLATQGFSEFDLFKSYRKKSKNSKSNKSKNGKKEGKNGAGMGQNTHHNGRSGAQKVVRRYKVNPKLAIISEEAEVDGEQPNEGNEGENNGKEGNCGFKQDMKIEEFGGDKDDEDNTPDHQGDILDIQTRSRGLEISRDFNFLKSVAILSNDTSPQSSVLNQMEDSNERLGASPTLSPRQNKTRMRLGSHGFNLTSHGNKNDQKEPEEDDNDEIKLFYSVDGSLNTENEENHEKFEKETNLNTETRMTFNNASEAFSVDDKLSCSSRLVNRFRDRLKPQKRAFQHFYHTEAAQSEAGALSELAIPNSFNMGSITGEQPESGFVGRERSNNSMYKGLGLFCASRSSGSRGEGSRPGSLEYDITIKSLDQQDGEEEKKHENEHFDPFKANRERNNTFQHLPSPTLRLPQNRGHSLTGGLDLNILASQFE